MRSTRSSEFDILSQGEDDTSDSTSDTVLPSQDDGSASAKWEWRFGLVLEDAHNTKGEELARMEVYVVDQDAECLLKQDAEE